MNMATKAINVIEVFAVSGQANGLKIPISSLVDSLRETSGCLSYTAVQSAANQDLWIITGHWESTAAMESHYQHPVLTRFAQLLGCHSVNTITVSSFADSRV
jgi:quinol monooxygenase YgiN